MPACVPTAPATSSPDRAAVLVTRPEPGAGETAARVTALGLRPIIAPLLMIAQRHATLPPSARVQAIVATSRNAIPALPASHRHLPLFAVGAATARRARAAGFEQVTSADADAEALAVLLAQSLRPLGRPAAPGHRSGPGHCARRQPARPRLPGRPPRRLRRGPRHDPARTRPPRLRRRQPCPPRCSSPPRPRKTCVRLLQAARLDHTVATGRCPGYRTVRPPWHYRRSPGGASASPPSPTRTRCSRCCDE